MSLRIIATGGTFDKSYDPLTGNLVFESSILPTALARARITEAISFESLLALDSLEMTDEHRAKILTACERSEQTKIVIIHGTDTMRETAEVIGQAALQKNHRTYRRYGSVPDSLFRRLIQFGFCHCGSAA